MRARMMYVELKKDGVQGTARIARVELSKTGKTLYYGGRTLEEFWISGPRADGDDSLYGTTVEIDRDCRREYWRDIRGLPERASTASYRAPGRSQRERGKQEKAARRRNMDRRRQPARFHVRRPADPDDDGTASEEA